VACGNESCSVGKRFNGKSECGIANVKLLCIKQIQIIKMSYPKLVCHQDEAEIAQCVANLCSFYGAGERTFLLYTGMALVFESVVANLCRPGPD
jgi:hypothetical protein